MPGISMLSGNIRPQSRMMILPSTSMQAQFRPISPSPPRKTIRTGSANVDAEIPQHLTGLLFEPVGRGPEQAGALAGREPQHPQDRLGGNRIGRQIAGLERP